MTVRVTTLKGADAGAYYVEALPNYYLQSGEPRGVWFGHGAQLLSLDPPTGLLRCRVELEVSRRWSGAAAEAIEVLFDRICRENGIKHILTRPRSPTTTGKIERWHKPRSTCVQQLAGP